MKILFATTNPAKLLIYKDAFLNLDVELITINDLPYKLDVIENGDNALENAKLKAKKYYDEFKYITLAEDDGLFLDLVAVDKQPGNEIRRFSKEAVTDQDILDHYSKIVAEVGGKTRARFIKGAAIYDGKGFFTFENEAFRTFVAKTSPVVIKGYPLSSLTYYDEYNKYLSELNSEELKQIDPNKQEGVHDFIKKTISLLKFIEKSEITFDSLIKDYDFNNNKICLKKSHSKRTGYMALAIAANQGLSDKDQYLAYLIGLLHDIGRFDQIMKYDTFNDLVSFDHGDLGASILIEKGLIKHFLQEENDYRVVSKAIINHNKLSIEEGLTDRETLFSKLIRDADKIDILYQALARADVIDKNTSEKVSPAVLNDYQTMKKIANKNVISAMDKNFQILVMYFDLYLPYSYKYLKEANYHEQIYQSIINNQELKTIIEDVRQLLIDN